MIEPYLKKEHNKGCRNPIRFIIRKMNIDVTGCTIKRLSENKVEIAHQSNKLFVHFYVEENKPTFTHAYTEYTFGTTYKNSLESIKKWNTYIKKVQMIDDLIDNL